MATSDFLNGGMREFAFKNYPVAMACMSCALDATAKLELGGSTRQRCMKFLDRYLDIVTSVAFGGAILAVPGSTLNVLDPLNPQKTANITEVVYDAVRCALIHEANLPFSVGFTDRAFYGREGTLFMIPTRFIVALLLAVVASPHSAGIVIEKGLAIILDGREVPIGNLAGNAAAVRKWLGIS